MQPTARILVFELFRKGDCFAIPFKKPALIANFAYHAQSQKIMDRQVESPKRNKYLVCISAFNICFTQLYSALISEPIG